MQVTLIHNPKAGDELATPDELRSMLAEAGYRVRVASTEGAWESALQHPADLVVAAGGDGTARRVALALAGSGTPFAVLPFGTANNIGKTLGVVGDAREIIAGWRDAEPRLLDLGVARVGEREERFVESAGAGLFADLIRTGAELVEDALLFVGRETDRALHLFATIAAAEPARDWRIEVDGRDHSGRFVAVEALNVRFGGPNIPLALDARPDDGLLDLVLVDEADRDRLVGYAQGRLETAAATLDPLPIVRGRAIRIDAPAGVRLHVDDEAFEVAAGEPARLEIRVLAGVCRYLPAR
ncbi:MAG TPA: diacylglycerol kinase family protein [Candidatus Limnocylindrales bacterium]|nr:diacylglycerol kinase family protein [Candidatus Limnocylindrales bacterium]